MRSSFLLSGVVVCALAFTACSGSSGSPDGNTIQVENGGQGTVPNAEIPSDFASAADALAAGKHLLDTGETAQAIDVLLHAVKMDPDLAEAYFNLGIAYSLVESEIAAVEGAKVEETPAEPKGKKPEEKKKNSEKAFESAVTAYKKLIAANKEDDNAHFYLGLTYNKLNEDEDAAKSLKEAVRLKPDNSEYQTELGSIYIKLAKYNEAVVALKKAIELDPTNIDAEELLEKAEAGKKRIDFTPPKKDEKQTGAANTSTNRAPNDDPEAGSPANTSTKPTPPPKKTPPAPARTPK